MRRGKRSERVERIIGRYEPKYVAYNPEIAIALGDVVCGLFVSQLLWWDEKGSDPEWVYKTQKEFHCETGLSRRNQETARKRLKDLGVLREKLKGVPAKLHYQLDLERLSDIIEEYLNSNSDCTDCTKQFGVTVQTRMAETGNLLHENTTENTHENLSRRESAPKRGAVGSPPPSPKKESKPKKPFALNLETDMSARVLKKFHDLHRSAMPEIPNELQDEWKCVRKWQTEANNDEEVMMQALDSVMSFFNQKELDDAGIWSFDKQMKNAIRKIKYNGTKVVKAQWQ